MQYVGSRIGYKASDHIQQCTPTCVYDEDDISDITQEHTQADSEEADVDEEADYGYVDDLELENELGGEDIDLGHEEENDYDKYDVL